jgi:hypothetical protein
MLPIYFLFPLIKTLKPVHLILILFFSMCLSMMDITIFFTPIVKLTTFDYYLEKEYFYITTSLLNKFTKYVFIPFFLLSILSLKRLNDFERKLFNLGFVSYCFRLILLPAAALNRLSMYFEILQILPLYFFVLYFFNNTQNKKCERLLILFAFLSVAIGLFAGKVIVFPVGEYAYKSIL